MTRFAMLGAAGFVARRHLEAIRKVGGELVAACDPHDSVGILDSYFPDCLFFTSFERFDRFINKPDSKIDYVAICSPNWLHDAHCRWALRAGCHAICEKPLVLRPWNVEQLVEAERASGRSVFPVLQLRLHPAMGELRERVRAGERIELDIRYVTRRGRWYHASWKGDEDKSGGILMNLGIHLFDAMCWICGEPREVESRGVAKDCASGVVHFDQAQARWTLSTRDEDLSRGGKDAGAFAERYIHANGEPVLDLSQGFTELHTTVYERILARQWITAKDAAAGISLVHRVRG